MNLMAHPLLALTLNLPMMNIVAQPFNIIKWQLKFNPVAIGDTLPHTVVGVCGEFQRTGRFLQRGI